MKLDGGADLVKGLAVIGKEHGEGVAALFKADTTQKVPEMVTFRSVELKELGTSLRACKARSLRRF